MEQEQHTVRKTSPYRLTPTPAPEQALDAVRWRCRPRSHVAREQRTTWGERGQGIGATDSQQKAEVPDLKAACPDAAEGNAPVVQEVILRVERADQAFFRRVVAGETPVSPRFQGRAPYGSLPYAQYCPQGGVALDGVLFTLYPIVTLPPHTPFTPDRTPKPRP